jgi:hypothetical protein
MEDNNSIHIDGRSPEHEWEPFDEYQSEYEHPVWEEYLEEGVKEGHGGGDHLILNAFVESVRKGTSTPIDAYDTATWMAIAPLSERSIALGSAPVFFPDFTSGGWLTEKPGKISYKSSEAGPF